MEQNYTISDTDAMIDLGAGMAGRLRGGEIFELSGDVGAGKTVFVKGLARGLDIQSVVQSPTYTISQIYSSPQGLHLRHYDFYRLQDPGLMREELTEALKDATSIVAIEWDESVRDILPSERTIRLSFTLADDEARKINLRAGKRVEYVVGKEV